MRHLGRASPFVPLCVPGIERGTHLPEQRFEAERLLQERGARGQQMGVANRFLCVSGHEDHLHAGPEREEPSGRSRALGLDPARPTRVIELTITGSPLGKGHALDDASIDLSLFIQDEDACLGTLLERHMDYYRSPAVTAQPGFEAPAADDMALTREVILHLAKVLLYLNLPEARQDPLPERSDLERRLRGLGKKKAARILRRMTSAYDRIVIGPRLEVEREEVGNAAGGDADCTVRPHWRRGHFRRIRYGEGLGACRLGWIRPVLVNASRAFGAVNAKPYVVR